MRVEILSGNMVIGSSVLDRLDPPMGVALGPFEPTQAYVAERHAGEVDGEPNSRPEHADLSVRDPDGGAIEGAGVHICDFQAALGEIEVQVIIPDPAFETYFAAHPHYRAYWGKG